LAPRTSYDEVAAVCGCPTGTVKSRVNRARIRLADLLAIDGVTDAVDLVGPSQATLWA
jgi:DNA-directed RNA polymerase specialized sigma24 family protein